MIGVSMAESTAMTVAQAEKTQALNRMCDQAKSIAKAIEKKLLKVNSTAVLTQYDIGEAIKLVHADPTRYGANAVADIAAYLGLSNGAAQLYNLQKFATVFTRQLVAEKGEAAIAAGTRLTTEHWLQLSRIVDDDDRAAMLERAISEGMSASLLEQYIRSGEGGEAVTPRGGGRRPAVPQNAMLVVHKFGTLAQSFVRFERAAQETIPEDLIGNIPPDRVDEETVQHLEKTKALAEEAIESARKVSGMCDAGIRRVSHILSSREETDTTNNRTGRRRTGG